MKSIATFIMIFVCFGLVFEHKKTMPATKRVNAFQKPTIPIKTGDVVFRSGKGFISDMFRKTSKNQQRFSHAGIAVVEHGNIFVYHMLGTPEKSQNALRKDKLADFCNSNENIEYAVYRFQELNGKETRVNDYIKPLEIKKLIFDEHFDFKSDDAMYCTEFIYKILLASCDFKLSVSVLNGNEYVPLDNLYINNHSLKITEVSYQ